MKYIRFGNAGIEVSRLALGCMSFPNVQDEQTACRILDKALDNGINLLDTADCYNKSEEVLGKILKGKRDKIILASKFWVNMANRPNGGGCSRVHIMQGLEASLRRLQTDYVDLFQLHHPDKNTPVEETLSTLDTLVKQGKIRYIGVCNHYAWQIAHMLGVSALHNWEPLVSVQCRYNIIDRAVENEIMPFAQRFNVATMIYGSLNAGILAGEFHQGDPIPENRRAGAEKNRSKLTDDTFSLLDSMKQIAAKYDCNMSQLADAWLLAKPAVTTILLGGSSPEHFDLVYGAEELVIEESDLAYIDELSNRWRYIPFFNQAVVDGAATAGNWW